MEERTGIAKEHAYLTFTEQKQIFRIDNEFIFYYK